MPTQIDRRTAIALMGATGAAALIPSIAMAEPVMGDVVMGNEDATVTVIEYASFTCPHCASFHRDTWPQFKEAYIDTGKVRFIMREVYFDRFGLWASMTARCGGADAFYPLADVFLKKQHEWARVAENQILHRNEVTGSLRAGRGIRPRHAEIVLHVANRYLAGSDIK